MAIESKRKFAVVTGASTGIGFALARECVSNGFDVMICSEDRGIETAASQLGASGARVIPV
ncbi:MAG: SDR family NAD(P)-dependent oxidoreductase, partial [Kofleriaceae bacterium]